ncbi:MAG: hypothetical protein V2I56_09870 [Desulfobacteraceae bacterium]|nr:hypothetical protein [Desulfobacteraceae bacterium]
MNRNTVLTEHYEELRQRALGQQPAGVLWGLVVLRTKGMAAWTKKWQEYAENAIPYTSPKQPAASYLPSPVDEVVQVLAGMVWALQKEVEA